MTANPIPDSHKDLLDARGFLHLASLGPDGEPQVHPVWYEWDGSHLLVSSTAPRQKTKNLARDGRIAGSILDPEDAYRYIEIRGVVESIEDDPKSELIDRLAKKYLDEDKYPWDTEDPQRVIIRIRPQHINVMG